MYHRWCLSYSAPQILRYFAPQFVTGKRVNTHPNFQYGPNSGHNQAMLYNFFLQWNSTDQELWAQMLERDSVASHNYFCANSSSNCTDDDDVRGGVIEIEPYQLVTSDTERIQANHRDAGDYGLPFCISKQDRLPVECVNYGNKELHIEIASSC
ncbi:hypothetical protein BGAL_0516g00050 [Botrytis galanthina]|uniref:Uncharacterized protein n=1 Tax=Botrytis galanthina TaxID=278940 RepID=A0A4S8QMJ8_9HELO|nr:hypothetical protein BGAL_0516g00050 [Botrytis galanthina]